jgi:hypothetical protein
MVVEIEFVLSGESEAVYCQIYLAKNCMPTEYYYILGSLLNISSNRKSSIPFTKSCLPFFIYVSYKGEHSVIYTIICNSKILVLHVKYFKIMDFKIGDVVQIGTSGHKGKIVNIIQPTGTYSMYTSSRNTKCGSN